MSETEIKLVTTPVNQEQYNISITKGLEVIASGGSKADAARAIYEIIKEESRDVIIKAFIEGATLTEKGSPTYYYNVKRQIERKQRDESKKTSSKKKKDDVPSA